MTGLPLDREGLRPHESVRPSRRAVESSQLRRPALFRSKDVARRMPSDDPPEAPAALLDDAAAFSAARSKRSSAAVARTDGDAMSGFAAAGAGAVAGDA